MPFLITFRIGNFGFNMSGNKLIHSDHDVRGCVEFLKHCGYFVQVKEGVAYQYFNQAQFLNYSNKNVWVMMIEDEPEEID